MILTVKYTVYDNHDNFIYFQFPKKKRIVGRVRCKNIKTECPKPTCMDPVLLPGRCCKVCPGQNDSKYQIILQNLDVLNKFRLKNITKLI